MAAQTVSASSTQDVVQWYAINVGHGTPTLLAQQGRVGGGNNTYAAYPAIDINPAGQIGMTYMQMGTDTATDFMSMWVTTRTPAATPPAPWSSPVLVPAGTGQANYSTYGGAFIGDQSGINIDPVDGSFWAVHEFANNPVSRELGYRDRPFCARPAGQQHGPHPGDGDRGVDRFAGRYRHLHDHRDQQRPHRGSKMSS